jgi:hypothetical protein
MTDWADWFAHCLFLCLSLYQPVLLPQGLSGTVLLSVFFCFATQLSSLPSAIYSPKLLTIDILLRVRYLLFLGGLPVSHAYRVLILYVPVCLLRVAAT